MTLKYWGVKLLLVAVDANAGEHQKAERVILTESFSARRSSWWTRCPKLADPR